MASLTDETLRLIAGNRRFRKNYGITRGLMFNPKTPLEVTLHLLPHMKPMDLKFLTTNKNVADTLRTAATRLMRQRTAERSS
jgi:pentose-5-phosphate-3-epimerase